MAVQVRRRNICNSKRKGEREKGIKAKGGVGEKREDNPGSFCEQANGRALEGGKGVVGGGVGMSNAKS